MDTIPIGEIVPDPTGRFRFVFKCICGSVLCTDNYRGTLYHSSYNHLWTKKHIKFCEQHKLKHF